jgi:hypothetical protein
MNDEVDRMWKEAVMAYFNAMPSIHLKGLTKTTKHLSYDS